MLRCVENKSVLPSIGVHIPLSTVVALKKNVSQLERQVTMRKFINFGCGTSLVIIVLLFVVLALQSWANPPTRTASYRDPNHDAGMACVMAEKLIKQQLKSPTSAEFDYGDCKKSAIHSGNIWTLRSYVDADNSFGAHIRSHYVAKLTNVPPSDTWRLVELEFID